VAKDVTLHVNDRLTLDVMLSVGPQATSVEVAPSSLARAQATPAVQTLIAPRQVQELPLNNRNFVQLATLVPGVSSSLPDEVGLGLTSTVSVSMAGARRNAVNWLVDGASNVDPGSNITLLSTPTLESVEEFRILTSSWAAEWPRSGGGIVNVVTKGGTNTFRASAYEFLRNDALNANGFFRKQVGCQADGTCSGDPAVSSVRESPPELDYHNFGYTLGGPVLKGRLFFFWSQEWRDIERAPTDRVAFVPDPAWLADPTSANYVPPEQRDPNAVRLLEAWPTPNTGENQYRDSAANAQRTRQEVLRLDWSISPRWRLMARYTHDLSRTTEPGGLFFGTTLPGIATTHTRVPGRILVAQLTTTVSPRMLNELAFQFSASDIRSEYDEGARNRRDQFGLSIPELFPENRGDLVPSVSVAGLTTVGANQLFDTAYRNATIADNLSWVSGDHAIKGGVLVALQKKDELSTGATQGSYTFLDGGGRTAFQSFLAGNAGGACGPGCTYAEPEREVASHLRWGRYEALVQDTWKVRPGLTLDLGVRYVVYPGVVDEDDHLTNFVPARFDPSRAPAFADAAGTLLVPGSGDFANGLVVAGRTSPHGRRLHRTEWGKLQPRVGFAWDLGNDGRTVLRGGGGIYYDEPLVGIFLQNAFTNPPFASVPVLLNPPLSNPGAGTSPTAVPPVALVATGDGFSLPRTLLWNVGLQRRVGRRAAVDVGYIGSRGDRLIQAVPLNQAQPRDVVAAGGAENRARPFPGYGAITMRQTTAWTRYHGLVAQLRYDAGRAGTVNVAYTLSRAKTTATNDRDTADLPQNPSDLDAEYALARNDRTHVLTASWVYELPFFRESTGLGKAALQGWQIAGIATFWSGVPIPQILSANTNGGRRGTRAEQVGDPLTGLPADGPGYVYSFDPAAFAPPEDGHYGTSPRAPFRGHGVSQWDLTLSKSWSLPGNVRLQLRADFINALNHTQLGMPAATCSTLDTSSCLVPGDSLGRITTTRNPREIQLGVRLSWN
jgi:hypothetical protein